MKERVQKLIAAAGLASRRHAEEWITAGRVTVNGQVAILGTQADPTIDRIEVDGRPLSARERKMYVLLNKPAGYVVSLKDPEGRPTITELVAGLPARLFPVGRLDYNTEGLLLLTNDGALAQRLAHPSHEIGKAYLVKVRGHLDPSTCERLAKGVLLDDGPTAPARITNVRSTTGHTWFEITIHEGRNRQVRRMCEAVGHPVARLKRIRLDFLELGDLPVGEYRQLSLAEVQRLKKL
jgi:23S rRNA pseudouridine2605 synthase